MTKTQKKKRKACKKEAAELRALEKKRLTAQEIEEQEEAELEEDMEIEEDETSDEELEDDNPPDQEQEEEETEEKERVEKSEEAMMGYAYSGPLSFDELDAAHEAEEKARNVRETAWNLQDIVGNILRSELEPDEKVDRMKTAADDFGERIQIAVEEEEKDLDLLQIQAMLAKEHRNQGILGEIEDLAKRVLSTSARKKLPTEKFALPSKRKYPINDKAHVRNALARAAQQIKRGGQSAADARAALPKIRSAAKRMGIGQPAKKERSAILIEKDANDQWRWVGWVTNNFIDWDGDILSESAHKEYVEWWEKNKDLSPSFISWHTPGTARQSPVDYVTYENGFLIMSGKLTELEAASLLKAQKICDLGMSHGTFVFGRDPKDPRVITKYRMYEASDLPLENAANPFTDFETVMKEAGNMDKLTYLTGILGSEEKAKAFLERTAVKQKELQEAGIESKEKTEETAPVAVSAPAPVPAADHDQELIDKILKAMDAEGLSAFVNEARAAMEKVPVLESLVKELQTKQDDKLAEAITPPAARFAWSMQKRASQASETVVPENDPLKNAVPGVPAGYWLSELTGTAPIKSD